MTEPGNILLDVLRKMPKNGRVILFLRHSKRDSFHGVPDNLRHGAEITPDGVVLARNFGISLQEIFPDRALILAHTSARRCRMTAECIGEGFSPAGKFRITGGEPEVQDPVSDPDRYIRLRDEIGWHSLMKRWLDKEVPDGILQDPATYSATQMRNLLSYAGAGDRDLLVVVGHDITLFPLIHTILKKPLTTIEFLNGIAISVNGRSAEVRFADVEGLLVTELEELYPADLADFL